MAILLQNFDEDSIEQELKKELAAADPSSKKDLEGSESELTTEKKTESSFIVRKETIEKIKTIWDSTKERFVNMLSFVKKST